MTGGSIKKSGRVGAFFVESKNIQKYRDSGGMFSWVDRSYLMIDANRHPYAIQLVPFYAVQWREGWTKYQGVYRAKLGVILRGAGITIDKPHQARVIDKVKREHDYMVEQGLIKSWRIVDQASKPINDLWEVVIFPSQAREFVRKQ